MKLNCFAIGINHNNTDAAVRGRYSIGEDNRSQFYAEAQEASDIESLVIFNTCNRVEIAGIGDVNRAIQMYKSYAGIPTESKDVIFVKKGEHAIEHLFNVSSGMDSKILGDLEILGQFKKAFQESKTNNNLNGYFERLGNYCFQAAKSVKSNTDFSSGTTSLSYAVVRYLKLEHLKENNKVLILGNGKFGSSVAKNIKQYFPEYQLILSNRTMSKAHELAHSIGCETIEFTDVKTSLNLFDIIITAVSNSNEYSIQAIDVDDNKKQNFIDLSMPFAIDPACSMQAGKDLIAIDGLSEIINSTLSKRSQELQAVQKIVQKHINEFLNWSKIYNKSNSIKSWKISIQVKIESCPFLSQLPEERRAQYLQVSVAEYAKYIKKHDVLPDEKLQHEMIETIMSNKNQG